MKNAAAPSVLCAVMLLAVSVIAEAQQPKKVHRIGYLDGASLSAVASRTDAFRRGLRELGYVEGKNIVIGAAMKGRAEAVLVLGGPVLISHRRQVADLAVKSRLPAFYIRPEYVEDGGLMYYGTNYNDLFRRAAYYVDKILKGATPADLPVEQPKKFEFVINVKAAKQIGLIPQRVLARADKVIR